MGADDRNEGHEPGECVEHAWTGMQMVAAHEGAYIERECGRCGAVAIVTPAQLGGWEP